MALKPEESWDDASCSVEACFVKTEQQLNYVKKTETLPVRIDSNYLIASAHV